MEGHSPEASASFPWRFLASSRRGASHKRSGIVNQDNCTARHLRGGQLLLSVADGHGSANCPYSHKGSAWAVECAVEIAEAILDELPEDMPQLRRIQILTESLCKALPRAWREKVQTDENFASAARFSVIEKREAPLSPVDASLLPYGSTLLLALLTETFALFLQLGDGDIRIMDETGRVSSPISADPAMIANETTSLCNRASSALFRCASYVFEGKPELRLVWLSTDGYANSYDQESGFAQAIVDTRDWLTTRWKSDEQVHVDAALDRITEQGSGDDISVALAWRDVLTQQDVSQNVGQDDTDWRQVSPSPPSAEETPSPTNFASPVDAPSNACADLPDTHTTSNQSLNHEPHP